MKDRILQYLKENKSITSWEAIKELGCTRLSAYILMLRNENYNITSKTEKTINRYGDKVHYAKYILEEIK